LDIDYFGLLKKSWKDFLNNKILFVPIIIAILIVFFLIFVELVFVYIVSNGQLAEIFSGNLVFTIIFCLLNFALLVYGSCFFTSVYLSMAREIIDTGKTSLRDFSGKGSRFLANVFWIAFYLFSLLLAPTAVLVILGVCLVNTVLPLAIFFFVLAVLYFLAALIFIVFGTYFWQPIATADSATGWNLFVKILSFSRQNLSTVFLTWVVALLVSLVVGILLFFIALPSTIMHIVAPGALSGAIQIIFRILTSVINVILNLVLMLFIFNVYFTATRKQKNKKK